MRPGFRYLGVLWSRKGTKRGGWHCPSSAEKSVQKSPLNAKAAVLPCWGGRGLSSPRPQCAFT